MALQSGSGDARGDCNQCAKNVGLNMVLFIAAIQQVPRSLYEAAKLDGAGRQKTFPCDASNDYTYGIFDRGHDGYWIAQSVWADLCDDTGRSKQ